MENKEKRIITSINNLMNNQLQLNEDVLNENNDNTISTIFEKYTNGGATLIIGLNCKTKAPKEVDFNEQELTPKRLTAKIKLPNSLISEITDKSLIQLIILSLNEEFENEFENEFKSELKHDYSELLFATFGNIDLLVDNKSLKNNDAIILIAEMYVDVISKYSYSYINPSNIFNPNAELIEIKKRK